MRFLRELPSRFKPKYVLLCLSGLLTVWLCLSTMPWDTNVFNTELHRRQIAQKDYTTAGLWLGTLGATVACMLLAVTSRWWRGREPSPLRPVTQGRHTMPLHWFLLALAAVIFYAALERWAAMGHSFWGDEGWAFCDYVHGRWRPAVKSGSLQDAIHFHRTSWELTLFGDRNGNNHWLASICQRLVLTVWQYLAGRARWDFDEVIVRLVPLTAGLASLGAVAFLLRRVGLPFAGITAAAFLALHPLHARFSVEARGYSMMLMFMVLMLWALLNALEYGRKRDWAVFGLLQLLAMYSWKGAIYPLAFVNTALGWRFLLGKIPAQIPRSRVVARWFAANLLGAMLFLPLTASSSLQISKSMDEVRSRAKPMEAECAHNVFSETVYGMPWHEQEVENPREISLQRMSKESPYFKWAALGLLPILGLGGFRLWKQDRLLATVCAGILLSGPAAALHFKYGMRIELLSWYLVYCVPILALLLALAVTYSDIPFHRRKTGLAVGFMALFLACYGAFTQPMRSDLKGHPREDHKTAWAMTRGLHEPRGYAGPSVIQTAWLWRYTIAYDPRGDTMVRSAEALRAKMAEAKKSGGQFYMVIGTRDLCEAMCADMMAILHDRNHFERIHTLWGVEPLNTLEIYRMKHPTTNNQQPK